MKKTITHTIRSVVAGTIALVGVATAAVSAPVPAVHADEEVGVGASSGVIVVPAENATIEQIASAFGLTVIDSLPDIGAYLVTRIGTSDEALATELELSLLVDDAVPNAETRAPEIAFSGRVYRWTASAPTAAGTQWMASTLRLSTAHSLSRGNGVVVAVIDTGVKPSSFFGASLVAGFDFVDGDTSADDPANGVDDNANGVIDDAAGHGTHVAGIIRQVAPAAAIMPIRVLDDEGSTDEFMVAKAMLWAGAHGAKVINASLGHSGSSPAIKAAIDELWGQGVIVVGAAGNEATNTHSFPAAAKCAISVIATTQTDGLAEFTSFSSKSDVAAPGVDIVSAMPYTSTGMASWSGTSMSSPIVAAQVALLRSYRPALYPGDVVRLVKYNIVRIANLPGTLGSTGRVDIVRSLQAAGTQSPRTGECLS